MIAVELRRVLDKAGITLNAGSSGKLQRHWEQFRIKQSQYLAGWKDKGVRAWYQASNSFYDWLNRRRSGDGN